MILKSKIIFYLKIFSKIVFWFFILFYLYKFIDKQSLNLKEINFFEFKKSIYFFSLFFALSYFLRFLRFKISFSFKEKIIFQEIISPYSFTYLIGSISPMRVGDLHRVTWLNKYCSDKSFIFYHLVWERLFDFTILVIFLLLGTLIYNNDLIDYFFNIQLIILLLISLLIFLFIVSKLFSLKNINYSNIFFSIKNNLFLLFISFLIWLSMLLAYYFFYKNVLLFSDISIFAVLILLSVCNLSFILSITPGNLIGFQAITLLIFSLLNYENSSLIIFSSIIIQLVGLSINFLFYFLSFLKVIYKN